MNLFIEKTLSIPEENQKLIAEFCLFCARELPIEGDFKIMVIADRRKHHITTTAAYVIGQNECVVYGRDRALPDIMRSIAHEMTHMMQDQMGLIVGPIRDAGGFHEDQANAKAGELLKLFAKSKPHRSSMYEGKTGKTKFLF
tara:strand:- start:688 stop:1113 length:426 start_codon:yes stop_codon:yes gene_type:complete